ncbi:MAG: HAD family phosphatase [Candidatus Andersenbacteria bacterium]
MKKYGILFDYNGVIVDDEHIHEKVMVNIMSNLGVELTHDLFNEHCLGRTSQAGFENLIHAFSAKLKGCSAKALTEQKAKEYAELVKEESIIHPAIKTVLSRLSENYRLGLVTASPRSEVIPILEEENLLHYFEVVVTIDDVQKGKPDPEGYLKGISGVGLSKDQILIVEDTPSGVAAAKASGAKCIAVLHTVTRDKVKDADIIVESVEEITPSLVSEAMREKS